MHMAGKMLIRGGLVITMDGPASEPTVADVHLEGDRIAAIGVDLAVPGAEEIDARGKIVFPGLIDGHRHVWQSLLRGIAGNWTLGDYMVEARSMLCGCFGPEEAYLANYLGGLESLEAGITTVVDHSHLQKDSATSDALARGLLDSGVGGIFCYGLQNVPDFESEVLARVDQVRDLLMRAPDDWHDANAVALRERYFMGSGPLKFGVALPEACPYLPPDQAVALALRAQRIGGVLVTGHWDANPKASGPNGLAAMRDAGVFRSSTALTHCNRLTDEDFAVMAEHGVGLCTCPDIEAGMGIGPLQAQRFVDRGGHASLGIDISSYMEADILKQARLLLQIERHDRALESGSMPRIMGLKARDAFALATIDGARAIGMGDEVGSLAPGKRADIAIAAPHAIMASPAGDPMATLMFYTNASDIDTVIVAGQVRKQAGCLTGVDRDALATQTSAAVEHIRHRMAKLDRSAMQQVWAGLF